MKTLIISFCILFYLFDIRCHCDFVQTPIVGIELGDAGFHRELHYTVQFDYPLAGKDCEYVIQQPLPAAVYVSVDQLDDLQRLKKLNAIYPEFVDIEQQTENSEPFTVLLKGSPKITDTIKLPIHYRYHAPSEEITFAIVDIATPTLYLNCPDNDDYLIDNEMQSTPSVKYCLHENASAFVIHETYTNDVVLNEDCDWKLINVDYQLKKPLRAKIPVGNSKAYPAVLYGTIIISWIVAIWTVVRTNAIPRRINQQLEEQRILQRKAKLN